LRDAKGKVFSSTFSLDMVYFAVTQFT